jgi:hypothetical protein
MVNGLLAQLVEQVTLNHRVVGSIPTQPTHEYQSLCLKLGVANCGSNTC